MRVRYAVSRTSSDRFPVTFRPDCERTPCDWRGDSETYMEVKERLNIGGYDLVDELPDWAKNYPHKRSRDIEGI